MKRILGIAVVAVFLAGCSSSAATPASVLGNAPLISQTGHGSQTIAVTVPVGTASLIIDASCGGAGFMAFAFSDSSTAADHIMCSANQSGLGFGGQHSSGFDKTLPTTAEKITIAVGAGIPWRFTLWTRYHKPDGSETFVVPSAS